MNINNWSDEMVEMVFKYALDEMDYEKAESIREQNKTLEEKRKWLNVKEKTFKKQFFK